MRTEELAMGTVWRVPETAADIESIRGEIEEVAEGWACGERVDWEEFIDRCENLLMVDLGDDLASPQVRAVFAIARRIRKESRA